MAADPHQVAEHTARTPATMRAAPDVASLKRQFADWRAWSKQQGVAQQIVDHVIGAYAEVNQSLSGGVPARGARPETRPAGRMLDGVPDAEGGHPKAAEHEVAP